jgi:hypothetical protein
MSMGPLLAAREERPGGRRQKSETADLQDFQLAKDGPTKRASCS